MNTHGQWPRERLPQHSAQGRYEQTGTGIDDLAYHVLPEALHYQKVINARHT